MSALFPLMAKKRGLWMRKRKLSITEDTGSFGGWKEPPAEGTFKNSAGSIFTSWIKLNRSSCSLISFGGGSAS